MNEHAIKTLEFDSILQRLADCTLSALGRQMSMRLQPMHDGRAISHAVQETSEARTMYDRGGHPPLSSLAEVPEIVDRVGRGAVLTPGDLMILADMLRASGRMKRYMADKGEIAPLLSAYAHSLSELKELHEMILQCIDGSTVSSSASNRLKSIRSRMRTLENRIQERLNNILSSAAYREYLQESYVTVKDGRYTIPVKAAYKHKIDGLVVGSSGSGSTVFLEPATVRRLVNELETLRGEEEAECYQVLAMLSGMAAESFAALKLNVETMAVYDFVFAKGKLSRGMEGREVEFNTRRNIVLNGARHPLLPPDCVPLDFTIGKDYRSLLITGPNTGGKTIALKTIGLLTLMAQAGLHVPVEPGSQLALFSEVWVDIGDGQSITQSLSTFSSHMKNIAGILASANRHSLVLLDEIGTGTDPAEGSALGMAILEDLYEQGAVTVATTHYGDLKRFSASRAGFMNGMMEFDSETLSPLYRLHIGRSGSSNGIWIAQRLGLKEQTLEKARRYYASGAAPDRGQLDEVPDPDIQESAEPEAEEVAQVTPSDRAFPVYQVGDRVFVHTIKESGVVAEPPDAKGMMTVMCRRRPVVVNHRRVTLERRREELYPDGESYDLRVVTMTKEDRRMARAMEKHHVPGLRRTVKGESKTK